MNLDPELLELGRNEVGGTPLVECHLRMGVDITSPCHHVGVEFCDPIDNGHWSLQASWCCLDV